MKRAYLAVGLMLLAYGSAMALIYLVVMAGVYLTGGA